MLSWTDFNAWPANPGILSLMDPSPEIRPLCQDADFHAAATLMASSDPWLRLGMEFDRCLQILKLDSREPWGLACGATHLRAFAQCLHLCLVLQ